MACSSSEPPKEADTVELPTTKGLTTKGTQEELFHTAKRLYEARMFSVARETFTSLRDSYPSGPYVTFADLKIADCYYYGGEYTDAAKMYEDFVKNHPGTKDLPYAQLQAGRSNLQSSKGIGRTQIPLSKSLQYFDALIKDYPDSSYAAVARIERHKAVTRITESEMMVIDYYEKKDATAAAAARIREFEKKWGPDARKDHSEEIITEPIKPLNVKLTEPSPSETVTEETQDIEEYHNEAPPILTTNAIQRVECRAGAHPFVSIELLKIDEVALSPITASPLQPKDGHVSFIIPDTHGEAVRLSCVHADDVRVSENGEVVLDVDSQVTVTTVDQPPRLLIVY